VRGNGKIDEKEFKNQKSKTRRYHRLRESEGEREGEKD
jgi:hypothetical protein